MEGRASVRGQTHGGLGRCCAFSRNSLPVLSFQPTLTNVFQLDARDISLRGRGWGQPEERSGRLPPAERWGMRSRALGSSLGSSSARGREQDASSAAPRCSV